jgi:hypothetical protein
MEAADRRRYQDQLALVKRMLTLENDLRLDARTDALYRENQDGSHKVAVTDALQAVVVRHFLDDGLACGAYSDGKEGLHFLRTAKTRFAADKADLLTCAQYLLLTELCHDSTRAVGDNVLADMRRCRLTRLSTQERTTLDALLGDRRYLVVAASSST